MASMGIKGAAYTETALDPKAGTARTNGLMVERLPKQTRQRIETALRSNGYEVTPEAVLQYYNAGKQ